MNTPLDSFLENLECSLQLQYAVHCCLPWISDPRVARMAKELTSMSAIYSMQGNSIILEHEELLEDDESCDAIETRIAWLTDRMEGMLIPAQYRESIEESLPDFNMQMTASFSESYEYHEAVLDGTDFGVYAIDREPCLVSINKNTGAPEGPQITFGLDSMIKDMSYIKDGKTILQISFEDDSPRSINFFDTEEPTTTGWGALLAGTIGTALITQAFKGKVRKVTHEQKA